MEISNKLNSILTKDSKASMEVYKQQLDYLELAINRLNADLALHEADDLPY